MTQAKDATPNLTNNGNRGADQNSGGLFVKWSKNLETGVAFVDTDHKVLINLLNQVHDCIGQNEETTVLGGVLDALVEYTDYHFLREEKMMELSGYIGLVGHKDIHRTLSGQVHNINRDYQADPCTVDPVDVRDFLNSWLINHIMGHDFAYRTSCIDNDEATRQAGEIRFLGSQGKGAFNNWEDIRIMVVDDNPNFRRLIKTILKAAGIRNVQVMESAREGIACLSQRPADVVLCDWMMDEMNGAEFANHVYNLGLPTRVVILSGLSTDVLKERSSDLNIMYYLQKPIKARPLLDTIAKAVMSVMATHDNDRDVLCGSS